MSKKQFKVELGQTGVSRIHQVSVGPYHTVTTTPPDMVPEYPGTTSPHHLFLAAIGTCVNLVFEIALERGHIKVIDLNSEIIGDYETDEKTTRSAFTKVTIKTHLIVPEGTKSDRINKLFEIAKSTCPIGNCLEGSRVKIETVLDIDFA